jgi:RNA polymerase sigma-B factor
MPVSPTSRHARPDRETATSRLLSAYRDQGDTRARERLVELYMPLVEALAHRNDKRGAEHDDLVQAGAVGLLNAIERFEPKRGEEFVAFAVPTVAGEIKRHVRDRTSTVRLPRRLHEASVRLPGAREELTAKLGRAPSRAELAEAVGVTSDDLGRLESATAWALEEAADRGTSEPEASEARLLLAGAFRTLNETDRRLLYLLFVRESSRREVADELGMSQSAVSRRTKAALAKLRTELEGKAFEPRSQVPIVAHVANSEVVPASQPADDSPAPPDGASNAKARAGHSGRLMLRMPQSLHGELAEAAEREEVSLNQFITNTLAAALAWNSDSERAPATPPRWLPLALVTNLVVVAIAAAIALALLIIAWQQGW